MEKMIFGSFNQEQLYIGIDVHRLSWSVTIRTKDNLVSRFRQSPNTNVLVSHLRTHYPRASYSCAYEAGFSGFWLQEALTAAGIACIVVHPGDVPTTDKEKRVKTDGVDSNKLARALAKGELRALYVPTREDQELRTVVRRYRQLVTHQTRCKNRIKSLCAIYNIVLPSRYSTAVQTGGDESMPMAHWSKAFLIWLRKQSLETEAGNAALALLLDELDNARNLVARALQTVRVLSRTDRYRTSIDLLVSIPGISTLSAMILLSELFSIDRFPSFDKLASYAGLVPNEHSSGESEHKGNITRRRNPYLRHILIESAWVAVRCDPERLEQFRKLQKRMKAQKAIPYVANMQLRIIRRVLRDKTPYVKRPFPKPERLAKGSHAPIEASLT